jgi:hypothetical protein
MDIPVGRDLRKIGEPNMDREGTQKSIEAHRGEIGNISRLPPVNDSEQRGVLLKGARPFSTSAGRHPGVKS